MKIDYKKIKSRIDKINERAESVTIMEVCGTHTMAISEFGLRNILGEAIRLISGPGCPVCVTPDMYIDYIYDLALQEGIVIATYGDMIRVPGSSPERTLEKAKALGAEVKIVYSSMDALSYAMKNPEKKVVFLGIGFETTVPATAIAIQEAQKSQVQNFYVLSLHKLVEPVMRQLLEEQEVHIDGFLCPGHVAAITGEEGFAFLKDYGCVGVVTGFQLEEVVDGLEKLIDRIDCKAWGVENAYDTLVTKSGNEIGKKLIEEVFEAKEDAWRGIGAIPQSGLKLKETYKDFDIERVYPFSKEKYLLDSPKPCRCGEVLKGLIEPTECKLFGKVCNPEYPVGPCMVSGEGSCAAYYKYHNTPI